MFKFCSVISSTSNNDALLLNGMVSSNNMKHNNNLTNGYSVSSVTASSNNCGDNIYMNGFVVDCQYCVAAVAHNQDLTVTSAFCSQISATSTSSAGGGGGMNAAQFNSNSNILQQHHHHSCRVSVEPGDLLISSARSND